MVKATFTIIDDDAKAKKTEVIEMVYQWMRIETFLNHYLTTLKKTLTIKKLQPY